MHLKIIKKQNPSFRKILINVELNRRTKSHFLCIALVLMNTNILSSILKILSMMLLVSFSNLNAISSIFFYFNSFSHLVLQSTLAIIALRFLFSILIQICLTYIRAVPCSYTLKCFRQTQMVFLIPSTALKSSGPSTQLF